MFDQLTLSCCSTVYPFPMIDYSYLDCKHSEMLLLPHKLLFSRQVQSDKFVKKDMTGCRVPWIQPKYIIYYHDYRCMGAFVY